MMATWCSENLRDAKAWCLEKLPMSVNSDEAAKMFDAGVRQLVSWSDCPQLGGIGKTVQRMLEAEPDFLMGRVLSLGLVAAADRRPVGWKDPEFNAKLTSLVQDAERWGNLREKHHARAVKYLAENEIESACAEWEKILCESPNDLLAIKFAQDTYIFAGNKYAQLNNIQSVINKWDQNTPCYSFLHGMHGFCLEEYGFYDKAMLKAHFALALQPQDCWATHAIAHCFEMNGQFEEGIKFMESTEKDWAPGNYLASHNYWHTALFYIEKGDYETALEFYDKELLERTKKGTSFQLGDCAQLLQRLQMAGVEPGRERWAALLPICEVNLERHSMTYVDAHIQMVLGNLAGEPEVDEMQERQMESMDNFVKKGEGHNVRIARDFGQQLCEAIAAFTGGNYAESFDKLFPIRSSIYRIGGSDAQRDVFTRILINAGFLAGDNDRREKALEVLKERESLIPNHSFLKQLVQKHGKGDGHGQI